MILLAQKREGFTGWKILRRTRNIEPA